MAPGSKVCFAASEAAPFAKTGGLGDVAGALPRALRRLGHEVRVFLPLYSGLESQGEEVHRVDFIRDVAVELPGKTYRFSTWTARQPGTDLWLYFIDCPELFHRDRLYTSDPDEAQRFTLFTRGVIESCQRMGFAPDVFHVNDWHTALLPLLLRTVYAWDRLFAGSKTLLTLHNVGYQGVFPARTVDALGLGAWRDHFDGNELRADRVNFLRTGIQLADVISTVSPTYAREIQGDDLGMGLQSLLRARQGTLVGILNGVDYDLWSPERDPFIPHRFSRRNLQGKRENKRHVLKDLGLTDDLAPPLLGIVSRLTPQKGFELCFDVLPDLLARTPARLAVLGSGDAVYESFFRRLQQAFPRQVCYYRGYSEELAHLIEAGADIFLMPSRYEPCGLNQMYSLRYGTIPVVRRTGGLADSVQHFDEHAGRGTGFVFDHFDAAGLRWALGRALRVYSRPPLWQRVVDNAMQQDFSWETQARRYTELYSWMSGR